MKPMQGRLQPQMVARLAPIDIKQPRRLCKSGYTNHFPTPVMSLKVLIVGAGATGGYFGGRLAQAAQRGRTDVEVTFLVRPKRAEMLKKNGLMIESPQGNFMLAVRTVQHTELKWEYDLVLLACKAYDLESAILSVYPAIGPDALILPILNGLAHFDRLDAEFGVRRILGGCCHLNGTLTNTGVVRLLSDLHGITFGTRAGNAAHAGAVLDRLQVAFRQTPVRVQHSETVLQAIWEKYTFLSAFAAMTCLMRAAVGDIMTADDGETLMLRLLAECEAAAKHAGYPLRPSVIDHSKKMLTDKSSVLTASMLRDLESGGRTESDHIVNDMRLRSIAAGSDATLLSVAWAHFQAREARLARERKAMAGNQALL